MLLQRGVNVDIMDNEELRSTLRAIFNQQGAENRQAVQHMVWMEEMGELIQVLSKAMRYGAEDGRREAILEEVADVMVSCLEIMVWYDFNSITVENRMGEKLIRFFERILEKGNVV